MNKYLVARAIHFGKIYRFMGMNGIIPSLENSTMLYRNPRRFNDPLDVSWTTRDVFSDVKGTMKKQGLKILLGIVKENIRKRDESKDLKDYEIEAILKKDLGIPSNIDIKKLYEIPFPDSGVIEIVNKLKPFLLDNEYLEVARKIDLQIRICCFSRVYSGPKSFLMWSHYADSHRGACLEFDTKKLYEKMSGLATNAISPDNPISYTFPFKVRYIRKLPKFNAQEDDDFFKWIVSKSKIWKYEDEVRMFYAASKETLERVGNENEVILPFPFEYLTKIIFGNLVGAEQITLIKDIAAKKYPANMVQFEKMEINPNKFNLFAKKLE